MREFIKHTAKRVIKDWFSFMKSYKYVVVACVSILVLFSCFFIYKYKEVRAKQLEILETSFFNNLETTLESSSNNLENVTTYIGKRKKKALSKAVVCTEDGTQVLKLDTIERNVTSKMHIRALHTITLQKFPISMDTLSARLQEKLKKNGVGADVALVHRINDEISIAGDSALVIPCDSLFTYYAGVANEHAFSVYASLQWISVYKEIYWVIAVPVLLILCIVFIPSVMRKIRRKIVKDELSEVIAIKEVRPKEIYEIKGKYIYDVNSGIIHKKWTHSVVVTLVNSENLLLQAFLMQGGDYKISKRKLMEYVWPNRCIEDGTLRHYIYGLKQKLRVMNKNFNIISYGEKYGLVIK